MKILLNKVLSNPELARSLAERGRRTITARHTCAHRVDELLRIVRDLSAPRGRDAQGKEAERDKEAPLGGYCS
jgi:spore maturation protein CgeB